MYQNILLECKTLQALIDSAIQNKVKYQKDKTGFIFNCINDFINSFKVGDLLLYQQESYMNLYYGEVYELKKINLDRIVVKYKSSTVNLSVDCLFDGTFKKVGL